ncbi:hypothetical protein DSLASN_18030 [Desulfoluna limicola]|uniref:Uncharacterized protein n=1 Tax=Desulfoluna limicola TaxID=2810562 RepID=A0ABM7PGH7_9BACT|nr:hypothetical protein DSLASN_18030 [Desulfoluna limicola]
MKACSRMLTPRSSGSHSLTGFAREECFGDTTFIFILSRKKKWLSDVDAKCTSLQHLYRVRHMGY